MLVPTTSTNLLTVSLSGLHFKFSLRNCIYVYLWVISSLKVYDLILHSALLTPPLLHDHMFVY